MTQTSDSQAVLPRGSPAVCAGRARRGSGVLSSFMVSLALHAGIAVAGVLLVPRIQPRIELGGGGGHGPVVGLVDGARGPAVSMPGAADASPAGVPAPPATVVEPFQPPWARLAKIPVPEPASALAVSLPSQAGTESTAELPALSNDWGPRSAPPSGRAPPWATADADAASGGTASASLPAIPGSATQPAAAGGGRPPYATGGTVAGSAGDGGSGSGSGGGSGGGLPRAAGVNPMPEYPEGARRRGVEGTVLLRITIRTDGQVEHLEIYQSSGSQALDDAAARAVRQWRFDPTSIPRPLTVLKPIVFRLDEP